MKITGVLGSSRKGGNTEVLLDVALEEAREMGRPTSRITLRDKVIAPVTDAWDVPGQGNASFRTTCRKSTEKYGKPTGLSGPAPSISGPCRV